MNIPVEAIALIVVSAVVIGVIGVIVRDDGDDYNPHLTPSVSTRHSMYDEPSISGDTIYPVEMDECFCIISNKSYVNAPLAISLDSVPDSGKMCATNQWSDERVSCYYIAADIDEPLHLDKDEFERLVGELR
jgi:hypothetical protein